MLVGPREISNLNTSPRVRVTAVLFFTKQFTIERCRVDAGTVQPMPDGVGGERRNLRGVGAYCDVISSRVKHSALSNAVTSELVRFLAT
jgi:hypothetical protein